MEFEIKNTIPLTLAPPTKSRYKYNKVYARAVKRKRKLSDQNRRNKWRDTACSRTGRLHHALPFPNLTHDALTIKTSASYFVVIEKLILNVLQRGQRLKIDNMIL